MLNAIIESVILHPKMIGRNASFKQTEKTEIDTIFGHPKTIFKKRGIILWGA